MPRSTTLMSAPTTSHRFAISFTKEIFVARNAFAAYLMSSAVCTVVLTMGVSLRNSGL